MHERGEEVNSPHNEKQDGRAPGRARPVARCLIESTTAILDVALEQAPTSARRLVDELVEMQLAYLAPILAGRS